MATQPTTTPPQGYEWRQNPSGQYQMFRIATSFGTGGASQATPSTPNQNSNITVPNNINANNLGNNQDINLANQNQGFNYNSFISSLGTANQSTDAYLTQLTNQLNQLNQPTQDLNTERTGLATQLKDALSKLTGQTARTQELVGQTKLTDLQKELSDLNTQIATRQAAFQNLSQAEEGRPIAMEFITGRQSQIQRQAAVELGGLAAVAQAVQGNIATAQDLITQTITAEFQPVLDEITTLKEQLALNYDNLSIAEKNRADQMNLILDERERVLNEEMSNKEAIRDIALEAAKNGAGAEVLKSILGSSDLSTAMTKASSYLSTDPLDELLSPNELVLFNAPAGSTFRDVYGEVPKSELTTIQKFTEENNLSKQFEALVGEPRKAVRQIGIIQTSLEEAQKAVDAGTSLNAASQGVLVAFQKLLDPTSVVRESEYARSGEGQSLLQNLEGKFIKLKQGGAGVTFEGLKEFVNTAESFLQGYKGEMLNHARRIEIASNERGLNLESILTQDVLDLLYNDNINTDSNSDFSSPSQPQIRLIDKQYNSPQEFKTDRPDLVPYIEDFFNVVGRDYRVSAEQFREEFNQFLETLNSSFSKVEGDTNTAPKVSGQISGLDKFDTFSAYPGVNRSDRNNNPGNIKVSNYTKTFSGVKGVESRPAQDGGYFLVFKTPQDGINAVARLLKEAKPYKGVTAEQAIKKYNGGGSYGALTLGLNPNQDFQSQIKNPQVLNRVVKALLKAEGYTGNLA